MDYSILKDFLSTCLTLPSLRWEMLLMSVTCKFGHASRGQFCQFWKVKNPSKSKQTELFFNICHRILIVGRI